MSGLLCRERVRELLVGLALLGATLALLLYPQPAMEAARSGLRLCGDVIIPSLFPFFVLSSLVVELGLASCLGRLVEGLMRPLFRVSGACASAVVLGFVGGYPVGAKTAIALYQSGQCTRAEAQRLLAFCNNSGPAFILGVVGAGVFASSRVGVLLCLAHAGASLCVGVLFRFYRGGEEGRAGGRAPRPRFHTGRLTAAFTGSVKNAFLSTLNICAFVVFFSVVLQLLSAGGILSALARLLALLGLSPEWARRLVAGVLELSSGVSSLSGGTGLAGRASLAAFMLGWAGLSVHCQVLCFLIDSGLSARTYLLGKFLHGLISAALTYLVTTLFPLTYPVSYYLTSQTQTITQLDFRHILPVTLATAVLCWMALVALCRFLSGKTGGK